MLPQLGMATITGLHVNEREGTEMEGYSLSLHEQLTVSSHRFAKLSDPYRPSATSSCAEHSVFQANQHSSSSLPLSFLPPSDKTQSFTCPFFGTIEGTVVCESKSNDSARRQPAAASDILLKSMAVATGGENLDCTSEECLASLPHKTSTEIKKVFTSVVSGQDTPCADLMMLVKGAQCLSIHDSLRSASTCKEEILLLQSEGCAGSDSKKVVSTFDLPPKVSALNESHGEQDAKEVEIFGVGHTPQPQDKVMLLDGPVDVQLQAEGCSSEKCVVTKEGDHDAPLRGATAHTSLQERDSMCRKVDLELALRGHDAKVSKRAQETVLPILDVVVGESTANAAVGMDCQDFAIGGSCKCKFAETISSDIQIERDTDDPAGCAPPISPKSVIQTVGQLRFWKSRLALIRQLRIFSDQVFELHRVIEVQRLIAGTPNVPINEMYFDEN